LNGETNECSDVLNGVFSLICFTIPLLLTQLILITLMYLLLLKIGFLLKLPLLNYLMLILMDSPSLTHLVLILIHALLQSLVAAQHFFHTYCYFSMLSLPISNIILRKLFSSFITISSKLRVIKSHLFSLFLTYLLRLTP